jgi:CelD/BcsL family acetyltransferase involved in cellulose biosynthesis
MNTRFSELTADWLALLPNAGANTVFLTPQFQETWWNIFGTGECHILRIQNEKGELLGLAPFFIKNGELSFFGDRLVSDYLDFIIKKGSEAEFFALLMPELKKIDGWQKISLLSIPEKSPTLSFLIQLTEQEGWKNELQQQDVCPVITLPKTWEEYLQNVGKKQRHEIKRKWRNAEEQLQPTFLIVSDDKNLEQDSSDFIRLHKLSSKSKAEFWDEKQSKYFRELITQAAQNNWLKLFFLEVAGQRVATMLCFDYDNQFYLYNSGYDPSQFAGQSIGNVLTSYTIKTAIEKGRKRYDFLRGNEEYKLHYGAVAEPVFDLTISR